MVTILVLKNADFNVYNALVMHFFFYSQPVFMSYKRATELLILCHVNKAFVYINIYFKR